MLKKNSFGGFEWNGPTCIKIIKTVHIYSVIHKDMYIKNDYCAQKM